ncbi:class I SAM-dependent methyltransferase [Vibrio fluminensis]|uniref:class I SAM-dependent methyltransferase n=1 Tax=Vibrio fluminensis TaxID=2783614 RepID=UPI0018893ECC|nr:class I SAM-dependent methyltransferase [Vibrio fluminensis]
MSEQYNDEVSKHYAAYRPPIHQMILQSLLANKPEFQYGLDIGCGTGVSTLALSPYCTEVVGVEPSEAMLNQAQTIANARYLVGDGENIPLSDNTADIITFAGSLYYAKSDALVEELQRVSAQGALVIAYDFEVQLSEFMQQLGIEMASSSSGYDHAINFSDCDALQELACEQGSIGLELNSQQLAHVLFSSSTRYQRLVDKFGVDGVFELVVEQLNRLANQHRVEVLTYQSCYRLS